MTRTPQLDATRRLERALERMVRRELATLFGDAFEAAPAARRAPVALSAPVVGPTPPQTSSPVALSAPVVGPTPPQTSSPAAVSAPVVGPTPPRTLVPVDPRSLNMEDRAFLRVALEGLLGEAANVGGTTQQRFGAGNSMYHQGLFGDTSRDPALFVAVNQVINDGEYSNEFQAFKNDPAKVKEYLARGGPLVEALKAFAEQKGLSGAFAPQGGFRGQRPPEWALAIARQARAEGKPVAEGYLRWLD